MTSLPTYIWSLPAPPLLQEFPILESSRTGSIKLTSLFSYRGSRYPPLIRSFAVFKWRGLERFFISGEAGPQDVDGMKQAIFFTVPYSIRLLLI